MRPAAEQPDAVGELLTLHPGRRRHRRAHIVGHGDCRDGRIRPDAGDLVLEVIVRHVQSWVGLVRVDQHRKHDAVKVLVARIAHLVIHIAVDRIRDPGANELDEILVGDRSVDLVLVQEGERNDRYGSSELRHTEIRRADDRQADCRGVIGGQRGFEKPMRRDRDLELPEIIKRDSVEIGARERHRSITAYVPGVSPVDDRGDVLIRHRRSAECRIAALSPRVVFARPTGLIVDAAGVIGDLVRRPTAVDRVLLADPRREAGTGVLNRLQILATHRFKRGQQRCPGIDLLCRGGPAAEPERCHQ